MAFGPSLPQATERQRIGNEIDTAFVTARARFVNVLPAPEHYYPRSRHAENVTRASLLDVDLTHPFLLANDLDLIA
jgi:hypothetical protein